MKNCIINLILNRVQRSEESHSGILYLILALLLISTTISFSQDITLEYIFQDTNIVNPRPTLKYINPQSDKIYYYADEDFDGSLSLFDMNYRTGETYKYSDTGESASEFIILPNGDAAAIMQGDLYISKNFTANRTYSKDIRLTESDKYEYSPMISGNFAAYRRGGIAALHSSTSPAAVQVKAA